MKDYSSEPFQFKIGDKAFVLQVATFDDLAKVPKFGELLQKDVDAGVAAIHDLIKAKSDKRTADAVMQSMAPPKILELIKDWTGLNPGESQTSGDE